MAEMTVSMDGLRRSLGNAFNHTVVGYRSGMKDMTKKGLEDMRQMIVALMCVYSPDPDDMMSDLSDELHHIMEVDSE